MKLQPDNVTRELPRKRSEAAAILPYGDLGSADAVFWLDVYTLFTLNPIVLYSCSFWFGVCIQSCRGVKYWHETIDSGSDHNDADCIMDRVCAVKKRRTVHDLNMGSVMPTSRYDEFKRIRRQQQKPKDWVELTMARAVLILFVFTLIYHLLTGL